MFRLQLDTNKDSHECLFSLRGKRLVVYQISDTRVTIAELTYMCAYARNYLNKYILPNITQHKSLGKRDLPICAYACACACACATRDVCII